MPALPLVALLAALIVWSGPAPAQASRPGAALSFAQTERSAIELRQGMPLEDVQKLLGKPRRTGLKSNGDFASGPAHGTLQWIYAWPGEGASRPSLNVIFTATGPDKWHVNSWEWSTY